MDRNSIYQFYKLKNELDTSCINWLNKNVGKNNPTKGLELKDVSILGGGRIRIDYSLLGGDKYATTSTVLNIEDLESY